MRKITGEIRDDDYEREARNLDPSGDKGLLWAGSETVVNSRTALTPSGLLQATLAPLNHEIKVAVMDVDKYYRDFTMNRGAVAKVQSQPAKAALTEFCAAVKCMFTNMYLYRRNVERAIDMGIKAAEKASADSDPPPTARIPRPISPAEGKVRRKR